MNILIIYDSLYGNTEKIARAIETNFTGSQVRLKTAANALPADLLGIDLLVIGSPTHGGKPSRATLPLLAAIAPGSLKHCRAAVFCTATATDGRGLLARFFLKLFGHASGYLARSLEQRGAAVTGTETFFVNGKEGPLREGELARAGQWINRIRRENKIG